MPKVVVWGEVVQIGDCTQQKAGVGSSGFNGHHSDTEQESLPE